MDLSAVSSNTGVQVTTLFPNFMQLTSLGKDSIQTGCPTLEALGKALNCLGQGPRRAVGGGQIVRTDLLSVWYPEDSQATVLWYTVSQCYYLNMEMKLSNSPFTPHPPHPKDACKCI